ncbi:MAG: hypothetical protein LC750_17810, partial [Actinobacteria bacterium]|nr:hypothetical protein [Actinomycetota bacterium]
TPVTLTYVANTASRLYGVSNPPFSGTVLGFVGSETQATATTGTLTFTSPATSSSNVGSYAINGSGLTATYGNYTFVQAAANATALTINPATLTYVADAKSRYFGAGNPPFTGTVTGFVLSQTQATATTGTLAFSTIAVAGSPVGTYPINGSGLTANYGNYTFVQAAGNATAFTINPDPTAISLAPSNKTSGMNFDCVNNQHTATLTDSITNGSISGITLRLTIGTASTTAVTDANGVATFNLTLAQPPATANEKVELVSTWTDTNRTAPPTLNTTFTILANPNIGPGTDASTLYTGSRFFWTTSSTSSTATLTLTATVKDTSPACVGNITKSTVSFWISSNDGSTWSPVSSAQNLPVGLVNPNDPTTGTASAISQYNLGKNKSAQLWVKVTVGGMYTFSSDVFDVPVTVAVPGQMNTLLAGGALTNDGNSGVMNGSNPLPSGSYWADGYLGSGNGTTSGAVMNGSVDFGGQVTYSKSGTNPQGQLTLIIHSYNKPDGTQDGQLHTYYVKSNSIANLSSIGNPGQRTASFSSKTNVYELSGSTRVGLDGGGTMQFQFTEAGGSYQVTNGSGQTVTLTCPSGTSGCASVVSYKSTGGVWFSSAWGALPGSSIPQTVEKTLKANSGTTYIA